MGIFARVRHELAEAFRINLDFLTNAFGDLPPEGSVLANELRSLLERDMAILVHKRSKWSDGDAPARDRWFADLETFIARSVRPNLSGESLLAAWNDSALMRALDAMVASEQMQVARVPARVPMTGRFDSHWAI
jgi:hypothetical protein